jgi:hypothetical protein
METPNPPTPETAPGPARYRLKIFGTGTAGVALLAQLRADEFGPAPFVAVDSISGAAGGREKIEIARSLLGGRGSHSSEPGKVELEGQFNAVKAACADCDTVFILAGLGGRTGCWMSLAVARAAREAGAQVFAFVTLPFDCEGSVRFSQAPGARTPEASCDVCPAHRFCAERRRPGFVRVYRRRPRCSRPCVTWRRPGGSTIMIVCRPADARDRGAR